MHAFGSYPKCGHYQLSEFTNSLSEFTNCEWWGGGRYCKNMGKMLPLQNKTFSTSILF